MRIFKIPPPRAPDCETNPISPFTGSDSANVASILMLSSVFNTPRQFGPTHLIPYERIFSRSCFSSSAPSLPVSLNPAVMIHIPLMPFSWHWSIVSRTNLALTTITARSTSPGTSLIEV